MQPLSIAAPIVKPLGDVAEMSSILKDVKLLLEDHEVFSYENGNTHGGFDEGSVIGWRFHMKLLERVKKALGDTQ